MKSQLKLRQSANKHSLWIKTDQGEGTFDLSELNDNQMSVIVQVVKDVVFGASMRPRP